MSALLELTVSIPMLWIKLYAKHKHVLTNYFLPDIHLHFSFISSPVENVKVDHIGKYDPDIFKVRHPVVLTVLKYNINIYIQYNSHTQLYILLDYIRLQVQLHVSAQLIMLSIYEIS